MLSEFPTYTCSPFPVRSQNPIPARHAFFVRRTHVMCDAYGVYLKIAFRMVQSADQGKAFSNMLQLKYMWFFRFYSYIGSCCSTHAVPLCLRQRRIRSEASSQQIDFMTSCSEPFLSFNAMGLPAHRRQLPAALPSRQYLPFQLRAAAPGEAHRFRHSK